MLCALVLQLSMWQGSATAGRANRASALQTAALEAARQALENTRERMPARPQQNGTSSTYVNTRASTQQSR